MIYCSFTKIQRETDLWQATANQWRGTKSTAALTCILRALVKIFIFFFNYKTALSWEAMSDLTNAVLREAVGRNCSLHFHLKSGNTLRAEVEGVTQRKPFLRYHLHCSVVGAQLPGTIQTTVPWKASAVPKSKQKTWSCDAKQQAPA